MKHTLELIEQDIAHEKLPILPKPETGELNLNGLSDTQKKVINRLRELGSLYPDDFRVNFNINGNLNLQNRQTRSKSVYIPLYFSLQQGNT